MGTSFRWGEDEDGRQGSSDHPLPASTGSYYLMRLDNDGSAITELHNDDGVVSSANGIGNPYLCRPDSLASG